jgi:3-hydroxymyristoyl/3-hydroxydecanoyl-(acyl carrier protein) dehydratase
MTRVSALSRLLRLFLIRVSASDGKRWQAMKSEDFHETVIAKEAESVTVEFRTVADWDYYDGHFPGFQILPAVAQVDIILRMADKYFGCGTRCKMHCIGSKRIKFSSIVKPGTVVRLFLKLDARRKTLSFSMTGQNGAACSSGSLLLGAAGE